MDSEQRLDITKYVYTAIKEHRYDDAIELLSQEVQNFPRSRAALSLLGYCYYHSGNYPLAVEMYEQLIGVVPDADEYKIYYAQSLYKAGMYPEATRASVRVDTEQHSQRMLLLQAVIKYEQSELSSCKSLLNQCEGAYIYIRAPFIKSLHRLVLILPFP